jgi:Protein kinase domain/PEGA domain
VLHQIGNGALGPVFRAFDQDRDRLVAIKLFRLDLPPERVHQLVAEFEKLIAAELRHPVIATPRAAGIDGNTAYLAQDFAAADSLDIVIRENGAASPAQTLRVAGQLAEALDYAADRQIVHGALHPRDILLSEEDIRIVGLGVARALERAGVTAPVRRPYAPPERINDGGWDRTADVFSLAAIVFEMLGGKRVSGTGSEAAEGLVEVQSGDLAAVQRVFALALASDPAYRYATATAFTDALKGALDLETAAEPVPASKPKRARPPLRVVAAEPELPLTEENEDDVEEVQTVQEVQEVQEETIEAETPRVRAPRRRRAPAPTPVAIETVHEPELVMMLEPVVEEPVVDLAFAPVEPAPVAELSVIEPDPDPEPEPEPALTVFEPPPHSHSPSPSPVWPIGVAAVLGIALGFGGGYTVAIRDRAAAPAAAITTAVAPPAGQDFTEVAAAPKANVSPAPASERTPVQAAVAPPPAAPPAKAMAFPGRVLVRSTPSGARVIVDGTDRGQTPATIRDLGRGEHHVRIVRDGYTSAERRVVLSPSQPSQSLSVPLAKEPRARAKAAPVEPPAPAGAGTLIVESRPEGAAVMIDGRPVGTTPLSLKDVRGGSHAVRIEREGYLIWTAPVKVTAGEQNRVTASLEK